MSFHLAFKVLRYACNFAMKKVREHYKIPPICCIIVLIIYPLQSQFDIINDFEDEVGKHLLQLLIRSLNQQYETLNRGEGLRGPCDPLDALAIKKRLEPLINLRNLDLMSIPIVMNLGCEELLKIAERDKSYFDRVIFLLDGDARYKLPAQKPKVKCL